MILFKCKSSHVTSPFKTLQWLLISEKAKALTRACKALSDLSYFSNLSPTIFHSLSLLQPYRCACWRLPNTLAPQALCIGLPWWLSWQRLHLQCGRPGFDSWVGKIPCRREWLLPFHGIPWTIYIVQKSWTRLSDFHFHFLSGYVLPQMFKWHIPSLLSGPCSDRILLERPSMTT